MAVQDLNAVPLHGQFVDLDGVYASGSISFESTLIMVNPSSKQIVIPVKIVATLDGTGSFTINIPATDDPDFTPTGFAYKVTENLSTGNGRVYYIEIPVASSGTLELADLSPLGSPPEPAVIYATIEYVNNAIGSSVIGPLADGVESATPKLVTGEVVLDWTAQFGIHSDGSPYWDETAADVGEEASLVLSEFGQLYVVKADPDSPDIGASESKVQQLVTAAMAGIGSDFMHNADNLSGLTSFSTARTNLGLGTAALLASSAVLLSASNLSDVASAATSRTNLGLGTVATLNQSAVALTANSLSDLLSASSARSNLGLGNSATRAVGTTAGTVAAGDDTRFGGGSGIAWAVTSRSSAYSAVASDIVRGDATTAPFTVTLPASSAVGTSIIIEKTDSSVNAVTLAAAASETIEGATTATLTSQGASLYLISNGAGLWIAITDKQTRGVLDLAYARRGSNLSDLSSASSARTNLGLGGAAVLSVGTTTGTVAAGDDSRNRFGLYTTLTKTAAYTMVANDLVFGDATSGSIIITLPAAPANGTLCGVKKIDATASTVTMTRGGTDTIEAITNNVVLVNQWDMYICIYDATAGTWRDLSRGLSNAFMTATYARRSVNLSDLASAATARTNLGLGGAAVLSVGTASGTVMAGNDFRVALPPVALTDAATIATDVSLGMKFRVTLAGNRTLGNPTNPTNGQFCMWEIIQDATGNRTLTLDTKFALGTDIASTVLTTTPSKRDFLGAVYNSTADKWYVIAFSKGY